MQYTMKEWIEGRFFPVFFSSDVSDVTTLLYCRLLSISKCSREILNEKDFLPFVVRLQQNSRTEATVNTSE